METVAVKDLQQMRNMPPAGTIMLQEDFHAVGYLFTEAATTLKPDKSQKVIDVSENQI